MLAITEATSLKLVEKFTKTFIGEKIMKYINWSHIPKDKRASIARKFLHHDILIADLQEDYEREYGIEDFFWRDSLPEVLAIKIAEKVKEGEFLEKAEDFETSIEVIEDKSAFWLSNDEDNVSSQFAYISGENLKIKFSPSETFSVLQGNIPVFFNLSLNYSGLDKDGGIKDDCTDLNDVSYHFSIKDDIDGNVILDSYKILYEELLNLCDDESQKKIKKMVKHLLGIWNKMASYQKEEGNKLMDEVLEIANNWLIEYSAKYDGKNLYILGISDDRYGEGFNEDNYDGETKDFSEIEKQE